MSILSITANRETLSKSLRGRPRNHRKDVIEALKAQGVTEMPRKPDLEYLANVQAFITLLSRQRTPNVIGDRKEVQYVVIQGRKYDRIQQVVIAGNGRATSDVIFFIDNSTGDILAPKTPFAPNDRRWYGTVKTISDWNWADEFPTPKADANVREVGTYGDVKFYAVKHGRPRVSAKPRGTGKRGRPLGSKNKPKTDEAPVEVSVSEPMEMAL